ncbi:MAG: MarR family transcriptional regulator [Acidimicrobiia bacterium]|nr:MarR family transcriptional regulator [Acidimicrobiia bacterium]
MQQAIADVRRFNRTVTQRVGALHDRYLARRWPLGAARVLWEIGEDGCEVRTLRERLDLDSGYLSRLLRSLEGAKLITVGVAEHDRRRRTARLTKKGRAERAVLDDRSEALARSLLDPLTADQRGRLVGAMGVVERLLTAALVGLDTVDPAHRDAQHCLHEYYAELDRRFDRGFDPAQALPIDLDEMRPPEGAFVVARLHGEPVGCGALKFRGAAPVEIKRLWVAASVRGLGVGKRLLADLEGRAAELGHRLLRLNTNRTLVEAIALYQAAGYREVPAFNDEPYAHHWFEKRLPATRSRRSP